MSDNVRQANIYYFPIILYYNRTVQEYVTDLTILLYEKLIAKINISISIDLQVYKAL